MKFQEISWLACVPYDHKGVCCPRCTQLAGCLLCAQDQKSKGEE